MRKPSVPVPLESSSIKRARFESGVTVYELAKRLGISPGAVSHMERSEQHGGIQVGTLNRALTALGVERREDRVTFELHRAVAGRLIEDPQKVKSVIPGNVERMRCHVRGPLAAAWLDRREELSRGWIGQLIDAMPATDELGMEMRQNRPFLGVLTQEERPRAIKRAA
jgi:transcriptional regulator with XRE-family HTH domain